MRNVHDFPAIEVGVEMDAAAVRLLSPAVGIWVGAPAPGALVGPGDGIGWLVRLNRRWRLQVPPGVAGRVGAEEQARLARPVGFGDPLLRLEPLGETATVTPAAGAARQADDAVLAVCAPTDGIYYLRSAPGAAPFVAVGAQVRRGQTVGLVEVMKTFNQILFDGPGMPDEARVREVRAADGSEVAAGDILVVFE